MIKNKIGIRITLFSIGLVIGSCSPIWEGDFLYRGNNKANFPENYQLKISLRKFNTKTSPKNGYFRKEIKFKNSKTLDLMTFEFHSGKMLTISKEMITPKGVPIKSWWIRDTLFCDDPALIQTKNKNKQERRFYFPFGLYHEIGIEFYPLIVPDLKKLKTGEVFILPITKTPNGDILNAIYSCNDRNSINRVYFLEYQGNKSILSFQKFRNKWVLKNSETSTNGSFQNKILESFE